MRHRELRHPELPCIKLQGGFIKKLLKNGVEKRHVSILPIEYVNVLFAAEFVITDHAHRWGPRGSPGLVPLRNERPVATQNNEEPQIIIEENEPDLLSEVEEELEYGDIPWALQDIYGICKRIHYAWEKHQEDSLKTNADHLAAITRFEQRILKLEQRKGPETKERTNGSKRPGDFSPNVGELRAKRRQPQQKNRQVHQSTAGKRVRFHNEDSKRHHDDPGPSRQWTPWRQNQTNNRDTSKPNFTK